MKIIVEVSPEEVKELFNLDKLAEMQQEVFKEIVKQSLKPFNPMENPFFNTGSKGDKSD